MATLQSNSVEDSNMVLQAQDSRIYFQPDLGICNENFAEKISYESNAIDQSMV